VSALFLPGACFFLAGELPMATHRNANPQHNPQIPQISVLEEIEALIRIEQRRCARLLAREEITEKCSREVTASTKRLQALYESYLRIQQELGLAPAYRRGPRPPETAPADEVVRHPMYPFLSSDEARDLFMMEELAKQGKIDVAEAYKLAEAINRYKEEQEAKRGHQ
jgi:hypothetical protein